MITIAAVSNSAFLRLLLFFLSTATPLLQARDNGFLTRLPVSKSAGLQTQLRVARDQEAVTSFGARNLMRSECLNSRFGLSLTGGLDQTVAHRLSYGFRLGMDLELFIDALHVK